MQRKKFTQLLLPALGYMIMGNLLALVMTFSLAPFRGETVIVGMTMLFAAAIYILLVAVPAYKDGLDQHTKLKKKKMETATVPKYNWLIVGLILWAIMAAVSIAFLIFPFEQWIYRVLNGATLQLSNLIKNRYVPFVNIGFYALTAPTCHIGFMLGLGDKLSKDKVMYK